MSSISTTSSTKSTVSDIYKKMSHKEHVLKKPDTYIGSVELEETEQYLFTNKDTTVALEKEKFKFCPGFYKCFDELIVNAFDHSKRQASKCNKGEDVGKVTSIKVDIDIENNSLSFYNNGDGIDVELIPEHNIYPPELIFGTLLTSTNYDDNEKREWGGRNGYGAKLANIFSTKMIIETVDGVRKKKYIQEFENNMSVVNKPIITKCTAKPYTKITWYPDLARFNLKSIDDYHHRLFKKRVYDISACSDKSVSVHLNKQLISEKNFEKYVNLYIQDKNRVFQEEDGWSVIATYNENEIFQQISFVNGINTINGGKHVDYVVDQIKDKLAAMITKKKKINVKPIYIKNQLTIFINSTIVNPVFDGQTKETLKTNKSKFEHYITINDKFIQKLYNSQITELIIEHYNFKENKNLEKTDGKKKNTIKIPKLSDANFAGTKKSKDCTLILTEGDSAKTMAIAGLSIVGRDTYGVFPLKGKVLNVRDAGANDIIKNTEIANIKKIIGLQSNKEYKASDFTNKEWPLRYGKIMLMTDQDLDGTHIKGLVINLFDCMWPTLLDDGFICSMITPIIKAKNKKTEKVFYTIQDFEKWSHTKDLTKWNIKYYKGLGTSTTNEAKEYFKNLKIINYTRPEEQNDDIVQQEDNDVQQEDNNVVQEKSEQEKNKLVLAFKKDLADERKKWLGNYNRNEIADYSKTEMNFNEFIDTELIHFSNYDNDRSIPNMLDGFKPSIRKTIYSCFRRNLTNEIKVAQLAGYISENSGYHHGEKSLEGTIVGLAQDFVGSNNLNLLLPIGQFGTRLLGGKDSAQSRYIFTQLSPLSRIIFNKQDDVLYKYLEDDGQQIEPEHYCGIIPMLLVNGTEGIGTGFSTTVPSYNPIELINFTIDKLTNSNDAKLTINPWYRGFNGVIEEITNGSYITKGIYEKINKCEYRITELPIGMWTEKYVEYLDKITIDKASKQKDQYIKSYKDNSTECQVNITVKFDEDIINKLERKSEIYRGDPFNDIEKALKLTSKLNTTNMWLFNSQNKLQFYNSIDEIYQEWYTYRFELYVKRKEYILTQLKKELNIIKYKVKFILEIIENTLDIRNKTKQEIHSVLESKEYPKLEYKDKHVKSYDYLLKMDLFKLSKDEIEKLQKQFNEKEAEVNNLEKKTINEIWIEELELLKEKY